VDAAPVGRPFVALAPGFEVFFTGGGSLVPAVLKGQPVVQIEFEAEVPWVLAEPAPEP
jgi:hypothetical protein